MAKSSTRSARIWSAAGSKPPETYPLTVWNHGGELLKVSHRVTSPLIRSTHQRCARSASGFQCCGLSGSHQSVSARLVPSGARHQPGTAPPGRR
ncbi:hypothetical protein HDA31_003339 [Micromonospora carbonacea subsp. aurantiaca]|nr:hypothetical protein [Micromonospora carbonacea]